MNDTSHTRRASLYRTAAGLTALASAPSERLVGGQTAAAATVDVDPTPGYELTPHL